MSPATHLAILGGSMDETGSKVLAAASELLRDEGPQALTNRRIAVAADCSTMAIYSRFGSKGGILDALYGEGFEVLASAQASVNEPDPVSTLRTLCRVYRETAHRYAGHYTLMFGSVPGWAPSDEARAASRSTFDHLRAVVEAGIDADQLKGNANAVTYALFAACHGFVALELAGYAPSDPDDAYAFAVDRVLGLSPADG